MVNELSADALLKQVKADAGKWNNAASENDIAETVAALQSHGFNVVIVNNKAEALEKLKELIPSGSEVMNGSSTTLNEIGFTDLLSNGKHSWKNMHTAILAEKDAAKQGDLRRKADAAEYFVASVNAISKTGELIAGDASGSRVGAFPFTAKNLVLVSGVNKIVPTMEDGLQRLREFAFPLENVRAKKVYGMGSMVGKIVILANEMFKGRTMLILVKEKLGY